MQGWKRKRPVYSPWLNRVKWSVLLGLTLLFGLNLAFPPPLKLAYQTSVLVTDHDGQWLSAFPVKGHRWRLRADLDEIDPRFIKALLALEDKRFVHHSGVDVPAVFRAMRSWHREGKAVSGASTLTMQLVRQLEPRPRTLRSKFIEMLRAMQIEARLSKREILTLYLTHTPYGGNIEGLAAATHVYFDKTPDHLTDSEIALLLALPQAPEARRPDRHPKAARKGRDLVLARLFKAGILTKRQFTEARQTSVLSQRETFPQTAWLTSRRLKSKAGRTGRVRTTLDKNIQKSAERLAKSFTENKRSNVAILVVDNKTMEVRASVGSAGRDRPGGWIDMTDRLRSPGSTLKPFIYGLAFDDGLSTPGSLIRDAPTRFGSYRPENFNRRYHGDVRVYEALAHSLNVPAVLALDKVGIGRFAASLRMAGADIVVPDTGDSKAGLAMALGGMGMTAQDLAVLYAALANDGEAHPLIWVQGQKRIRPVRLIQAKSARALSKILRQAPTPSGRVPHWLARNVQPIAYKTGTSWGFRDAWAVGYTDKWTVVVWHGHPDGSGRIGATGRKAAAPLLFDMFSRLPGETRFVPYKHIKPAPKGVEHFAGRADDVPQILFPPDKAEILADGFGREARGLTLTASLKIEKNRSGLKWYVNGTPVSTQSPTEAPVWHPEKPGFYTVELVSADGTRARSRVRVLPIN